MSELKQLLLVCQGFFCQGRGSRALLTELQRRQQVGELPDALEIKPYYCFNGCSHGPNVVSYPTKIWFERVGPANLDHIITYLKEGSTVNDPALRDARVPLVVRENTYREIEQELAEANRS